MSTLTRSFSCATDIEASIVDNMLTGSEQSIKANSIHEMVVSCVPADGKLYKREEIVERMCKRWDISRECAEDVFQTARSRLIKDKIIENEIFSMYSRTR